MFLFSVKTQALEIKLAVFDAPPYQSVSGSQPARGLILDVLTQAMNTPELTVKVIACPFARCLRLLESNQVDVMGGMIKTPEREQSFQYLTPAYINISTPFKFYSLNSSNLEINHYEDLAGLRIGVVRASVYFPRFDNDTSLIKVETKSLLHALEMLKSDRIDVILAIEATAEQILLDSDIKQQQLTTHHFALSNNVKGHIVFSDRFSQQVAATKIRERYVEMVKNGELDNLLEKYQLPSVCTSCD